MMHITRAVQTARSCLPITWPLQSFIANNPLWEQTHLSFEHALRHLQRLIPVQGLMPFSYYYECWNKHKITFDNLQTAINAYIERHFHKWELQDKTDIATLFTHLLTQPDARKKINDMEMRHKLNT